MSGLLDALLDVVFPARCAGCGLRGEQVCAACRPSIPWLGTEACPSCASPARLGRICRRCTEQPPAFDGARAACRFEGIARSAIHDLKFRGMKRRAVLLGELVAEALEQRPLTIDALVPVPLSPNRRRLRGFNQSALIAGELGRRIGVPIEEAWLERTRDTAPQVGRSGAERGVNVVGAFACREPASVAGRRIALVDDVMTTGSTLSAGAEALKASGAARVFAVVVARDV